MGIPSRLPTSFQVGGTGSSGHNRDPSQDRTRSYMRVSRDPTPEVESITNSIPFASAWRRKMVEEDVIRLTQVSTSTSPNPGMVTISSLLKLKVSEPDSKLCDRYVYEARLRDLVGRST